MHVLSRPRRKPGAKRAGRRLLIAVLTLFWVLVGLAAARPAAAHAQLISSDPASGSHLTGSPHQVTLRFSEHVSLVSGGIQLLDGQGRRTTIGLPQSVGSTLSVPIPETLSDGWFVLVYRVVSADTHPVGGAVPFAVGRAGAATPAAAAVGPPRTPGFVRGVAGVDRWLSYAGAILVIGVPVFVLACWPGAARDRRFSTLTGLGAVLVILTALLALPVQGARSTGSSLRSALSDGSLSEVLNSPYGHAMVTRIGFVLAVLALLVAAARLRNRTLVGFAGVAAVGMALGYSRAGHPAVSSVPVLTLLDDAAHLGAVSVWLGGLVVLAFGVLPDAPAQRRTVLTRWSRLAMASVATLVLTGVIQAWRELRSLDALVHSSYGHWLLVKSAGLVLMLVLGNLGRRRVQRYLAATVPSTRRGEPAGASVGAMLAAASPDPVRPLRAGVVAEVALGAAVLVASAALVVTTPGRSVGGHIGTTTPIASTASRAATGAVDLPNDVHAEIRVEPATAGTPDIDVVARSLNGAALDPPELDITAALPSAGIEPITLRPTKVGPGHWTISQAPLSLPGEWTFTLTVRTTEVDAGVGTVLLALH